MLAKRTRAIHQFAAEAQTLPGLLDRTIFQAKQYISKRSWKQSKNYVHSNTNLVIIFPVPSAHVITI